MGWDDVPVDADFVRINIHIISNYVARLIYHSEDETFYGEVKDFLCLEKKRRATRETVLNILLLLFGSDLIQLEWNEDLVASIDLIAQSHM